MLHELYIKVSGQVQNVGFRYQTNKLAKEFNLTGWVKNTDDGIVEILAQGEKKYLTKLLTWARKGPGFAKVEKLDFEWRKPTVKVESFEVSPITKGRAKSSP